MANLPFPPRTLSLFFELFSGELPRHAPGDAGSTLKALAMVPGVGSGTRVLDVGCGTGAQTLVIAQQSAAHVVAVDSHPPFLEVVKRKADALGIADRVDARIGDMRHLEFAQGAFDLIWSEGAIYIMGFEAGLREWGRLLAPGGYLAVTELCWIRPDPPADCAAFWGAAYPVMRDVPTLMGIAGESGYEMVGHFTLPPAAWEHYYQPLQLNVAAFRTRHAGEPDAEDLANEIQREIDVWRACSEFYSYEFLVMRARAGANFR